MSFMFATAFMILHMTRGTQHILIKLIKMLPAGAKKDIFSPQINALAIPSTIARNTHAIGFTLFLFSLILLSSLKFFYLCG